MKRNFYITIILCGFSLVCDLKAGDNARPFGQKSSFKNFIENTPWTFIVSGHVVHDNGKSFGRLFDFNKSWNKLFYPTKLGVFGDYKKGWSFGMEFAYTKYKTGNLINSETIGNSWTFFSTDMMVRYDLNRLIGKTNWFKPYGIGGYGYTLRTGAVKPNAINANIGLGFNICIWENLGFNAQSVAKFALLENTSNYLNHSVGIFYKIQATQGYRKGQLGKRYPFISNER